ncbi:hypothetical protein BDF21DRAFT_222975 [Thamnidium elegans]|nr:hypothetical protein BDF21DRAFT_222975 [Thamnidium elegans]
MEIDKNKPKPVYLTTSEWNDLCNNFDSEYSNTTLSQSIASKLYEFSFESSKQRRNNITATITDEKIQSFLNKINDKYGNTFEVRELEEDTYLQFTLEPLLNILFKNRDGIAVNGSSSLQSSKNSRKKFDNSLLPKKADYCVSVFYDGLKKNGFLRDHRVNS